MDRKMTKWEKVELLVLFLFAISLFNLAGYIFSALMVVTLWLNLNRVRIGLPDVLLVLFSVFYFSFYVFHNAVDVESIILFLCGPWAAFQIGKLFVEHSEADSAFSSIVVILAAGMFLHGALNWLTYLRSSYYLAFYQHYRQSIDVWRGTLVNVNATGMFFTFAAGLSLGVLFADERKKIRIFAACILAACVGVSAFFANRTLLVIVVMIFAWRCVCWLFARNLSDGKKLKAVLVFMGFAVILLYMMKQDIGGIGTWFGRLKIVERFSDENELGRVAVWKHFIKDENYLHHMFGGGEMLNEAPHSYMHNLWLDVYNAAGIFPFTVLVLLTLWAIGRTMYLGIIMRNGKKEYEYTVFACLMVAVLLNSLVEPIIESNPYYFLTAIMFLGAAEGQIKKLYKEQA